MRILLSPRSELRYQVRRTPRSPGFVLGLVLTMMLTTASAVHVFAQQEPKTKEEQKEQTKPDVFKVQKLTQGLGLYELGPKSPDNKSVLGLAQKPNSAPNLYLMNLADHSIRPPLTNLKWGVSDPQWSPDGQSIAFSGSSDTATFDEIFVLEIKTGTVRQLTKNAFSDKEPVFMPDGKRLLYTSDESPLPNAAFGILHVASIPASGGKPSGFTEDDCSSIHPGLTADGKSVLLVKVSDASGRHSLWQYGLDGKPQRDLTEEKFARIRKYITGAAGGVIVVWGQEQVEQQGDIYLLDPRSGQVREFPEPDLPKASPSLSPDGKLIAFVAGGSFGSQLYIHDLSSDKIKQLTFKPAMTHSPVFVSNGEILFVSDRDGQNELYSINLSQPIEEKKKSKSVTTL
jgi:Tol biopolymer transport system component